MVRKMCMLLSLIAAMLLMANVTLAEAKTMSKLERNDTLLEIARENHTTIEDLLTLNKIHREILVEDQEEFIVYEVKKGDTLYWLAKDFNTTVDSLMTANGLDSSLILIGQELKVFRDQVVEEKVVQAKAPKTKATTKKQEIVEEDPSPQGETMTVTATAYTAECDGCSGITYTGVNLLEDRQAKVIAVDPQVIPLGTKVHVEGYGYAVAEDIGGAIKGNRIDIHLPTKDEAYSWGVREVEITILKDQ